MNKTSEATMISKETLLERIAKGTPFQLVNVLDPKDYTLGMIKGSRKIPLAELPNRLNELDKSVDVVTYCSGPGCSASQKAAELLTEKGYRVNVYPGGIKEWVQAKLPLEAQPAPATTPNPAQKPPAL